MPTASTLFMLAGLALTLAGLALMGLTAAGWKIDLGLGFDTLYCGAIACVAGLFAAAIGATLARRDHIGPPAADAGGPELR